MEYLLGIYLLAIGALLERTFDHLNAAELAQARSQPLLLVTAYVALAVTVPFVIAGELVRSMTGRR